MFALDNNNTRTLCDKSNIGYEGECLRCVDTVCKYEGETSRTGFTRMHEHMSDYRSAAAANLPPQPNGFGTAHQDHPRKPFVYPPSMADEGLRIIRNENDDCRILKEKNKF